MKYILLAIIVVLLLFILSYKGDDKTPARIISENVEYKSNGVVMEGFIAYDGAVSGKRPAVIIVHEWDGLGNYVKSRAEQIARLGYVAFCADIYGKGVRASSSEESAKLAGTYRANPKLMRERITAALEELKNNELVDKDNIAAMGYCFGGGTVLELARTGADIKGVISFHGNLNNLDPATTKPIQAKILVLHGADDKSVTPEAMTAFEDEMRHAKTDWQIVIYGNAVHGFTNPAHGNDPGKGAAYEEKADKRSWEAMKSFLKEIFSPNDLKH
ncbi:MAG: dienelactone hydrolase family protein [Planctomycetes bacterium]|nr:dienelactone hydrolase family protein [Planctomycetota bacterium]